MATSEAKGKTDTTTNAIVIRKCHELDELRSCVSLQKEVWNFSDAELIPLRMFVVAEKIGGQVIGAFEDDQMIGFALAIPGTRDGHPYLHSQMVGVREGYRNSGLGRRIKWFQRDDTLSRSFELMEWTFDPLEIKNAYLNIEKPGRLRRYHVNQYGLTTSPLQGGLPSDRLIAEWWLNSRRVRRLSGKCCSADRRNRRLRFQHPYTSGKPRPRCGATLSLYKTIIGRYLFKRFLMAYLFLISHAMGPETGPSASENGMRM
jgi:predicted GNAT superfamily acetyltransferase